MDVLGFSLPLMAAVPCRKGGFSRSSVTGTDSGRACNTYLYLPRFRSVQAYSGNGYNSKYYIDNQGVNNYLYDEIGNLIQDKAEGIDSIKWNVYGKIARIIRHDTSDRNNLEFRYDASGQRIAKIERKINGYSGTYYVRDASGNVMAVYKDEELVDMESINYFVLNNWIIENIEMDSLRAFVLSHYDSSSPFTTSYIDLIANDYANLMGVYDQYSIEDLMDRNPGVEGMILQNFMAYSGLWGGGEMALLDEIKNNHSSDFIESLRNCYFNRIELYEKLMGQDFSDEWLNHMAMNDFGNFDLLYNSLRNTYFPMVPYTTSTSQRITDIRTNCTEALIAAQMDVMFGGGNNSFFDFIDGFASPLLMDNFLQQLGFQDLFNVYDACGYGSTLTSYFKYSFPNQVLLRNIIKDYVSPHFLVNALARDDLKYFYGFCFANNPSSIGDALGLQVDLSYSKYLDWIRERWGKETVKSIIDDQEIVKSFTLAEQHLYGSSRVGVYRAKKVLQRYNILDGNRVDSFTYISSTTHFTRTLTRKEYELSNHLGNVLATVLDRRSANNDSTFDATIAFYKADVVQATLYYPFGMGMMSYKQEEFESYRFGNNTQERDDEIYGEGNSYSAEYWQYDARLGRRWNIDPIYKDYESPYACFGNSPIFIIDINGKDSTVYLINKESTKTTYVYGDNDVLIETVETTTTTLTNAEMETVKNHTKSIFDKNGIKLNYVVLTLDQSEIDELELDATDAIIKIENRSSLDKIGNTRYFGLSLDRDKTYVNNTRVQSNQKMEDKLYALGFIAAHEVLHQFLENQSFGENGIKFPDHNNNSANLNTDATVLSDKFNTSPSKPSTRLQTHETILLKHKNAIAKFFEANTPKNDTSPNIDIKLPLNILIFPNDTCAQDNCRIVK